MGKWKGKGGGGFWVEILWVGINNAWGKEC